MVMPIRIEELIPDLRSPTAQIRLEAAQMLGASHNPLAVDALIEALQDTDTEVVMAAIDALSRIGEPAVLAVLHALQHPDSDMRYAATIVLGNIGEGLDALMDALDDPNPTVQGGAAEALEQIGTGEALAAAMAWRKTQS
jgi:HEAT repeat protein